jgi:hypothetical protein
MDLFKKSQCKQAKEYLALCVWPFFQCNVLISVSKCLPKFSKRLGKKFASWYFCVFYAIYLSIIFSQTRCQKWLVNYLFSRLLDDVLVMGKCNKIWGFSFFIKQHQCKFPKRGSGIVLFSKVLIHTSVSDTSKIRNYQGNFLLCVYTYLFQRLHKRYSPPRCS